MDLEGNEQRVDKEQVKGEIEFKNVWFRYPNRKNDWIFTGLNLKISPNESLAIVGESGCGKSTLISLILRFYDPDIGEILLDGVNINTLNLNEYRLIIGYVMQEPILFNYTVKENLLYGSPDSKNSELLSRSKEANAFEFLEKMNFSIDDSGKALFDAYTENKKELEVELGEGRYKRQLTALKELMDLEIKEGKTGIMNLGLKRPIDLEDVVLPEGFDMLCGVKGIFHI